MKIPQSSLPAIVVKPYDTESRTRGTVTDTITYKLDIVVIFNAKDYYKDDPADEEKVYAVQAGVNMAGKTDNNQKVLATSIAGVIQSNKRLPYTDDAGGTQHACLFCNVERIRPILRRGGRKFPTYEIVTTIKATTVSDRP